MPCRVIRAGLIAMAFASACAGTASARTVYDGSWSLTFVTRRGSCDPSYHFTVAVTNGIVSHANFVKFQGRVQKGGAVRASVSAFGKYAAGTGRLTRIAGQGRWSGGDGKARCSGVWTATKI